MTSSTSTGEVAHDTTDDEQSRLSRRSSVLNDLFSLFRRSSSFHLRSQNKLWLDREGDEDEEVDEDGIPRISKDRILEMIQQKKEIIAKLREEPWSMSRKRKALIVAQKHLKKQQAKVSKVQLIRTDMSRGMRQFSRLFVNLKIYLIPWEMKIKKIESHFGSVVSSYFTFLRWVLGVNVMITLIMGIFVIVPEWLADAKNDIGRYNRTAPIKVMPPEERARADSIYSIFGLEGYFKYSLLFYGFYSQENFIGETITYRIPLAYFLSNIAIIALSFVLILRKMAANARTSKISSGKTEQYVFNWKTFTGLDYTIGNPETATNVSMANVIKFREAIAEYNVKQKAKLTCTLGLLRVLTNSLIFGMLAFSVWAIYTSSILQNEKIMHEASFFRQNAVSLTVSAISLVFPAVFDLIGVAEKHHPKFALKLQLCRVLVLYIVNYITIFISLYQMLEDHETNEKKDLNAYANAYSVRMELDRQHNASMQTYYDVAHYRTIRQLSNMTYSYSSAPTYSPTPTVPTKPWTTVLPDFGPFGVSAPRAVVSHNGNGNKPRARFTAHPIGPQVNWTSPAIITLNYTGGAEVVSDVVDQTVRYGSKKCWETRIGQEITKLVMMDVIVTVGSIFVIDFIRGLGIRWLNIWCCWNLETTFPEYGEFKVAENVLHLANNQGMVWLGLFFVPLLPLLNNIKLIIIMYIRGWACMTCNVPARQIFRASRSNNFFLGLLLFMLFMSMIPFGFVIASKVPSKTCGPFAGQEFFYSVIANTMKEYLNDQTVSIVKAIISPGIIIPIIIFLLLVIYFLFSLVGGLREANDDLTTQLTHERTEEKKKIFELAGGKNQRGRGSIFFKFTDRKKKPKNSIQVAKRAIASGSENEDSAKSLPRSMTSITNKFVPSLGSVSEVDHSDSSDDSQHGEKTGERSKSTSQRSTSIASEGVKLSLKQRFLICIGWSDPKKYERIPLDDLEAGIQSDQKRSSSSSSSSSSTGEESDEDEDEPSFLTASQGIEHKRSRAERSITASLSRKISHTRSKPLDVEYVTPSMVSPTTGESGRSTGSSASSETSNSRSVGYRRNQLYLEVAQSSGTPSDSPRYSPPNSHNHKPSPRTRKRSGRQPDYKEADESAAGDVSTRPPSQDGSFRDDVIAPNSSSEEQQTQNVHSSYTSAMLSPIMARVVFPVSRDSAESEDDRSDRAPLVPPHGSHRGGEPTTLRISRDDSSQRAFITRPPRFRISSSPPKTPNSEARKFEVHVCSSPKSSRVKGRGHPKETQSQTQV
ncbi:hypothetical protein PFISCL1PPCAC_24889 [Pristionchus fissidentatus]|uniref:TMC domain-containing protein n=1 Tax=Pristionchus fissidentatus TaxID=1538716 RepID=A0AAV5WNK6_9BILA|nr:hypothetical protein PFISCL1PPCAC_24889 [Pristionchus fissidentatus]